MKKFTHNELLEDLAIAKGAPYKNVNLGGAYGFICKHAEGTLKGGAYVADVLRVRPSYTRFCVDIYEVKVSRSDFLSDIRTGKWKNYLPHCHRFYFAIKSGIAKKEEIPKEAGLLIRGDKGWSTNKMAENRNITVPYDTLLSVIFYRQRHLGRSFARYFEKDVLYLYKGLDKKVKEALFYYDRHAHMGEEYERLRHYDFEIEYVSPEKRRSCKECKYLKQGLKDEEERQKKEKETDNLRTKKTRQRIQGREG